APRAADGPSPPPGSAAELVARGAGTSIHSCAVYSATTLSDGAPLPRVRSDDPEYRRLAHAEAEYWNRDLIGSLESLETVQGDSAVDRWTNERFTGDRNVPWQDTIAHYGVFRRGLILGTSAIGLEARILLTNPKLHLTFVDISPGILARRREQLGARFPGRVDVAVGDLNFVELAPAAYDLIVSSASIHHVTNLEHLAWQINRALTPDGYFFLQDYVGEPRFQFSAEKKRLVALLIDRETPPEWKRPMMWLDASDLSPFCGVRSDDVLPTMRAHVAEERIRTAAALSAAMLRYKRQVEEPVPTPLRLKLWRTLDDRLRALRGKPPRARLYFRPGFVDELMRVGDLLSDAELLAPGNAFAIYRKRAS